MINQPELIRSRAAMGQAVPGQAAQENFPVAPFFLPGRMARGLMAIYGFARLVDDIGDMDLADPLDTARILEVPVHGVGATDTAGLSAALLDAVEEDLRRAALGNDPAPGWAQPRHPLIQNLGPVIHQHRLSITHFRQLIAANRYQHPTRYRDFDQLTLHCTLSANPVGRLVLELAGSYTADRVDYSDRICTALQVIDHLQDVAADWARGRIHLPIEDLAAFGVEERDLNARSTSGPLRELVAFEARRARALLSDGAPLVGTVSGRLRLLVAGFVAGGYAALDALASTGYDVLARTPRVRKASLIGHAALTWARGR